METPQINKSISPNIPSEISNFFTDELKNYLVIKDGNIIITEINKNFKNIIIKNEENNLKIIVPKNFYENQTLHFFYFYENKNSNNTVTIELEANAELSYFEYLYNIGETKISIVSNTYLSENSKLTYTGITNFNELSQVNIKRNSYISAYGRSLYSVAEVNDGATNVETNIYLNGKDASATIKTVAITSNKQKVKIKQIIEHNAVNTEGYIENYGVSNNQSTLIFEGIGKISKNMKKSVARQQNRGIVLGEKARLEANPLLFIDEYDVEASHGAAIGKIDEEQLYYLMSRGLTIKDAERLIITGFLSPVVKLLTTKELKNDFVNIVNKKTL